MGYSVIRTRVKIFWNDKNINYLEKNSKKPELLQVDLDKLLKKPQGYISKN